LVFEFEGVDLGKAVGFGGAELGGGRLVFFVYAVVAVLFAVEAGAFAADCEKEGERKSNQQEFVHRR